LIEHLKRLALESNVSTKMGVPDSVAFSVSKEPIVIAFVLLVRGGLHIFEKLVESLAPGSSRLNLMQPYRKKHCS
jgi:hypothetical protein